MISLTCTNCKSVLEMDEAFAGGVCRCQHCGTIQTVPSHLKASSAASVGQGPASKMLYQKGPAGGVSGASGANAPSGLDQLADAVVSSGLSSSGMTQRRATAEAVAPPPVVQVQDAPPPNRKKTMLFVGIGAAALLLLGILAVVLVLVFRHSGGTTPPGTEVNNTPQTGGPFVGDMQEFKWGVTIAGPSVVYVVDRANSIANRFDSVRAMLYNSLHTLKPDQQFAVICCISPDDKDFTGVAYPSPPANLVKPTTGNVADCFDALQRIDVIGQTTLRSALDQALALKPADVVVITAKSDDELNADLAGFGDKIPNGTKVNALVAGTGSDTLKKIADQSHGKYQAITMSQLGAVEMRR